MCIHLFNPPEPSCQPVTPRDYLALPSQPSLCGTCQCVPKYWQIFGTAKPGASAYTQLYMAQILRRDLTAFNNFGHACQWVSLFDLFPVTGSHQFGSIVLLAAGSTGPWTVTFTGLDYPDPIPTDIEGYSQQAFGFPDTRPQRCLNPNTLYHTGLGSGNFDHMPDSIVVQPFWP